MTGWVCRGEGVSDWEISASIPPLWDMGDILGHLAAWCWITGVLTLASSVTLGKPFHLSEP